MAHPTEHTIGAIYAPTPAEVDAVTSLLARHDASDLADVLGLHEHPPVRILREAPMHTQTRRPRPCAGIGGRRVG